MRMTEAARTLPRPVFQGYLIGEVGDTRPALIPGFVLNQAAFRRFFELGSLKALMIRGTTARAPGPIRPRL